jgi:carbamoyltransferase
MRVLGVHGSSRATHDDAAPGYALHDSAAVLLDGPTLVAAAEEERFTRVKHSNAFPQHAIEFCLATVGTDLESIDAIAINFEEGFLDDLARARAANSDVWDGMPTGRRYVSACFERAFGTNVEDKLQFCNHHVSHAWSAYGPSGFEDALVLVLDGDGDDRSGVGFDAVDGELVEVRSFDLARSLGNHYTSIIRLLGFGRFDEYKAMGLAPYGDPTRFRSVFAKGYALSADGGYELADQHEWLSILDSSGLGALARPSAAPFNQDHRDIAAALQSMLEEIVLHVLSALRESVGRRRLCFAGGVAHNCTLNGRILASGLFDEVFVQPAAHDAGGAWGAALSVVHGREPSAPRAGFRHLFLGLDVEPVDEVRLESWGSLVTSSRLDDIEADVAGRIADGQVVAWVQGRAEFGPRALGHRSILADPRPAANRDRINSIVKKREGFRPFAPSVLLERAAEFFDLPLQADYSTMIHIVGVREEWKDRLGAITHVDGTARIQTVSDDIEPRYARLLREFEKLTGIPILLNTSFNVKEEPIVNSLDDAIETFLSTTIDALVVGDHLIERLPNCDIGQMVVSVPSSRKLVRRYEGDRSPYQLESTHTRYFASEATLSESAFALLSRCDGRQTLNAVLDACGLDGAGRQSVIDEVRGLWSRRTLHLSPRH